MKRYLSGIDWFINGLDYASRRNCGIGNISQVVLELKGRLRKEDIQKRLTMLEELPVIYGSPSRALNLCPYWKTDKKKLPIILNTLKSDAKPGEVISAFGSKMNSPFSSKFEHLVFNHIENEEKSFLGMVFDHRLMAARGAEELINMLGLGVDLSSQSLRYAPAHLNKWVSKFKAGRKVNRMFISFSENKIRVFPVDKGAYKSNFNLMHFNRQESDKIGRDSSDFAGYLMFMPYILAKSIMILHRVFEKRGIPAHDYLIPVSIDKRTPDSVNDGIFFNHLSFLFFKIKHKEALDIKLILDAIKNQMYEQIKSGLPEAIAQASYLMRIAPLSLLNLFIKSISRTEVASFSFSFIGESVYNSNKFMENDILNIFHLPRVPYPPGVGIFFNQFQGELNATLSYIEGMLSDDEIKDITRELESLA
jgi:hypothetical protein